MIFDVLSVKRIVLREMNREETVFLWVAVPHSLPTMERPFWVLFI